MNKAGQLDNNTANQGAGTKKKKKKKFSKMSRFQRKKAKKREKKRRKQQKRIEDAAKAKQSSNVEQEPDKDRKSEKGKDKTSGSTSKHEAVVEDTITSQGEFAVQEEWEDWDAEIEELMLANSKAKSHVVIAKEKEGVSSSVDEEILTENSNLNLRAEIQVSVALEGQNLSTMINEDGKKGANGDALSEKTQDHEKGQSWLSKLVSATKSVLGYQNTSNAVPEVCQLVLFLYS